MKIKNNTIRIHYNDKPLFAINKTSTRAGYYHLQRKRKRKRSIDKKATFVQRTNNNKIRLYIQTNAQGTDLTYSPPVLSSETANLIQIQL